jgi:thiosulfate reductase cytochrome b subunit
VEGSRRSSVGALAVEGERAGASSATPDCDGGQAPAPAMSPETRQLRHAAFVRVTHWLTALAFLALLVTGIEILLSHPRFYWGETGNVNTDTLFKVPVPSSRGAVPTGYGYVLPDQNGWSRALHFQSAWLLVFVGLAYLVFGFAKGHFGRNLVPLPSEVTPRALARSIAQHLRFPRPKEEEAWSYNVLQRLTYLVVIFVVFPLIIWTGLAMSPAFTSAVPATVTMLGGRQSARTLHFFLSGFLVLFLLVHIFMIVLAGFRSRVGAMITGRGPEGKELP